MSNCNAISLSILDMPEVKPYFEHLSKESKFREASREDQLLSTMLLFLHGYKLPKASED